MAGVGSSEFDCPVCFNFFTTPKLLPCYHLVCQSCVLSWIERTGGRGQCPVCRAPVLSEPRTGSQLQTEINRLPTDLATQALAESHSILSGPHQCGMCKNNVAAQDICLQCSIKLCSSCTSYHQELPASAHHTVQHLNTLTVKQLAARHRVKCQTHTHELAKLYCIAHSKLVCFQCGFTSHRGCPDIREVEDVTKEARRLLQDRLERLETSLNRSETSSGQANNSSRSHRHDQRYSFRTDNCSQTSRAALARVLKVGDRVKLTPKAESSWFNMQEMTTPEESDEQ